MLPFDFGDSRRGAAIALGKLGSHLRPSITKKASHIEESSHTKKKGIFTKKSYIYNLYYIKSEGYSTNPKSLGAIQKTKNSDY